VGDLRTIRIFEDTPIKLILTEQAEKDVLALRPIIGENNLVLQVDGRLMVSHFVGFAQMNRTRLLIYPKYSRSQTNDEAWNQSFNILIKMLITTGYLGVKQLPSAQEMAKYKGDILEVLISLFIDELLRLFRCDINRGYQDNHANEPFIRGKIDFANHIRQNSYRKHIHALVYEHFSEDILMNRIFKTIMQNLVKITRIQDTKIRLGQALIWLEDIDTVGLDDTIWDQVVFTRLNHQYQVTFQMARLFYQNSSINLNRGDTQSLSFLVPLNKLFEQYVGKIIKCAASPDDKIYYQGPSKPLAYVGEQSLFSLRPDISIFRQGQFQMIIDAKYKETAVNGNTPQIAVSDLYQMLAYSIRYDCNLITLAYPAMMDQQCEQPILSRFIISKQGQDLTVQIMLVDLKKDFDIMVKIVSEIINAQFR
jgi:5-methylcytosine-specific restriction enzyme subunit McrC